MNGKLSDQNVIKRIEVLGQTRVIIHTDMTKSSL